jgi:hypothetical protein
MDNLSKRWTLKSLTIGPQIHETNAQFWEEAFEGLPPLPGVDSLTIIYNYPSVKAFNTDCWEYFGRLVTRRDLFPALKLMGTQARIRSQELSFLRRSYIHRALGAISSRILVLPHIPNHPHSQR